VDRAVGFYRDVGLALALEVPERGAAYAYTVMARDPFVAPYNSFLRKRTPKPEPAEPRAWRKDEYPD
jgi:hypothetical protein